MELRHLRYFAALAEHLNFSEASRRIHVAQPAISQTILDLEEELGVRLLLRDRRTVQLTAPGETFGRSFQLEVRSEMGEGSTVTMRIPLRRQLGVGFESPVAITPDLRKLASH